MNLRLSVRLFVALLVLAAGATVSSPIRAQGETAVVEAADGNVFEPATITINVGDTVTWRNIDDVPHTSTSDDGVWDSGALAAGEEFSFTFEEAGTYPYFCEFHPGMEGTVVVQEAAQQEDTTEEAEPTAEQEPAATEVPEETTEGDQQGGAGDDQQGEMPDHTPETGAGGMAGGVVPIAGVFAAFSLLFAGAYGLLRGRS
jgi:plastocyanin